MYMRTYVCDLWRSEVHHSQPTLPHVTAMSTNLYRVTDVSSEVKRMQRRNSNFVALTDSHNLRHMHTNKRDEHCVLV